MNINFTPAIRNTVLGGVAALAIAGGAMVSCQNNTKSEEEILEQTLEILSNSKKLSAETKVLLESILSELPTDSIETQKIKED